VRGALPPAWDRGGWQPERLPYKLDHLRDYRWHAKDYRSDLKDYRWHAKDYRSDTKDYLLDTLFYPSDTKDYLPDTKFYPRDISDDTSDTLFNVPTGRINRQTSIAAKPLLPRFLTVDKSEIPIRLRSGQAFNSASLRS
jgi:hypothetical protein